MKRSKLFLLTLLSSILLTLPWYQQFSGIIIIVAFIPLLFIEDYIYNTQGQNKPIVLIGYVALAFAMWNILATYWVKNAATLNGKVEYKCSRCGLIKKYDYALLCRPNTTDKCFPDRVCKICNKEYKSVKNYNRHVEKKHNL